jgi:curved DNA-binding protein CbpA
MNNEQAPKPVAQGRLSKTPFAHLLLHIMTKSLDGTLAVWTDEEPADPRFSQDRILFEKGRPIAARLISRSTALDRGLLALFERRSAPYAFYTHNLLGKGEGIIQGNVDPYLLIAAALRGGAQDDVIERVLQAYEGQRVRLRDSAQLDRYGFIGREDSFLRRLTSEAATIEEHIDRARDDRTSRRVLYLLAITKALETKEPAPLGTDERSTPQKPQAKAGPSSSAAEEPTTDPGKDTGEHTPASPKRRMGSIPPAPSEAPDAPPHLNPAQKVRWREVISRFTEMDSQTFFEMLGVAEDPSPEQLQSAYIAQVKLWHPDKNPPGLEALRPWSERIFRKITEARETLEAPEQRAAYLRQVRGGGGTPEADRSVHSVVTSALEVQKAEVLVRRRNWKEARQILHNALKLHENDADAHALMAEALLGSGSLDDMTFGKSLIEHVNRALELHEDNVRALFVKARVHQRKGDNAGAIALFKRVVSLQPQHHDAARALRLAQMRNQDPNAPAKDSREPEGLFSKLFNPKKRR